MRTFYQVWLVFGGVLAVAGAALAQVPSSNDTSDTTNLNTGSGSGTLAHVAPSGCVYPGPYLGCYNSAAGYDALTSNTTGTGNSAFGLNALWSNTTGNGNTASGLSALFGNSSGNNNVAVGNFALYFNSDGANNTATGASALRYNPHGSSNTADGYNALGAVNSTGYLNVAVGADTLESDTAGANNAALGADALQYNTTGSNNTASGSQALAFNTSGNGDTASGESALESNTIGNYNTASGFLALQANIGGSNNTASGVNSLYSNGAGNYNSAVGANALYGNTSGANNSACGADALAANTTGNGNSATGLYALGSNTTGSDNIGIGYYAGYDLTNGSNNIEIGSVGAAADNDTIRIGTHGTQKAVFIAGIYNSKVTGSTVVVTATGKLGVIASSERFKTAIKPMNSSSEKLRQLRPVTFHLKTSPNGAVQYGLIAEEVARVYPELAIRDEHGRIDGVRYDELAPMLLNESQKQQQKIADQGEHVLAQAAQIKNLEKQLAVLQSTSEATQATLRRLQATR